LICHTGWGRQALFPSESKPVSALVHNEPTLFAKDFARENEIRETRGLRPKKTAQSVSCLCREASDATCGSKLESGAEEAMPPDTWIDALD
jgi:hypothetical protein